MCAIFRTLSVAIARQTEITSQLLIKTCRRIETNLAAGKSIESDIKDIEAFRKNYEAIRERTEKQMTAHRESLVKRNASEKMLKPGGCQPYGNHEAF